MHGIYAMILRVPGVNGLGGAATQFAPGAVVSRPAGKGVAPRLTVGSRLTALTDAASCASCHETGVDIAPLKADVAMRTGLAGIAAFASFVLAVIHVAPLLAALNEFACDHLVRRQEEEDEGTHIEKAPNRCASWSRTPTLLAPRLKGTSHPCVTDRRT